MSVAPNKTKTKETKRENVKQCLWSFPEQENLVLYFIFQLVFGLFDVPYKNKKVQVFLSFPLTMPYFLPHTGLAPLLSLPQSHKLI